MKSIINKIIKFIDTNEFSSLASLIIGGLLWILGYKIFAGVSFGVFLTKNWSIIRSMLNNKF